MLRRTSARCCAAVRNGSSASDDYRRLMNGGALRGSGDTSSKKATSKLVMVAAGVAVGGAVAYPFVPGVQNLMLARSKDPKQDRTVLIYSAVRDPVNRVLSSEEITGQLLTQHLLANTVNASGKVENSIAGKICLGDDRVVLVPNEAADLDLATPGGWLSLPTFADTAEASFDVVVRAPETGQKQKAGSIVVDCHTDKGQWVAARIRVRAAVTGDVVFDSKSKLATPK